MATELAPDAAAFLAELGRGPKLAFRDMAVDDMREATRQMGDVFDAPGDPDVAAEDAEVAASGHMIPLRLYTPPGCDEAAPVVLFIHGGGWLAGDLDSYDSFCRFLARRSALRVASVGYRRAPETVFPGALDDALAAAHWLVGGHSAFGTVADLVLSGDSAGGGIAVAIARHADAPSRARALLLFYPVLDVSSRAPSYAEFAENFLLEAADMDYFIDRYVPDAAQRTDPGCSPLLGLDPANLPPTALLTCSHDVLRDEGRAFAAACHAAGLPFRHVEATGHVHGILGFRKIIPSSVIHIEKTIDSLIEIIN